MLEAFRRTHDFRAPSCLCAFLDDEDYSESVIGIVEVARGNADGNHDSIMNGQYVAACARQRCGYFRKFCLESGWMKVSLTPIKCRLSLSGEILHAGRPHAPKLHKARLVDLLCYTVSHLTRFTSRVDEPLDPQELNYFSDLRGTAQRSSGLSQILGEPEPAVYIRRNLGSEWSRCLPVTQLSDEGLPELRQLRPEVPQKAQELLMRKLVYGMTEDSFWETFVQCFVCKDVMFRLGIFSYHRCRLDENGARNFKPHPYVRLGGQTPRCSRLLEPGPFRAHLNSVSGDVPEAQPHTPMRSQSGDLTPTEVASDSEADVHEALLDTEEADIEWL